MVGIVVVKPLRSRYVRATSLDEALARLDADDGAKILAGGQSLMPLLNMRLLRPTTLVDINGFAGLNTVDAAPDGGLRVGALVRQTDLSPRPSFLSPGAAAGRGHRHVGHVAIRNRGTVGGSVAHADPAAEWPALLLALDGEVRVQGPAGTRTIAAQDFFVGPFMTAIEPEELRGRGRGPRPAWRRLGVRRARPPPRGLRLGRRGGRARARAGRERDRSARRAFTGVGEVALRIPGAEALLTGDLPSDERWREAQAVLRASAVRPRDRTPRGYRRHRDVAGVIARRAVSRAACPVGAA